MKRNALILAALFLLVLCAASSASAAAIFIYNGSLGYQDPGSGNAVPPIKRTAILFNADQAFNLIADLPVNIDNVGGAAVNVAAVINVILQGTAANATLWSQTVSGAGAVDGGFTAATSAAAGPGLTTITLGATAINVPNFNQVWIQCILPRATGAAAANQTGIASYTVTTT
jgi:hypothetical protein